MDNVPGVHDLELVAGDYLITPSEYMRDVSGSLSDLASGDLMEDGVTHLYDVETADGGRVLEIVDDRRHLKSFSEADSRGDFFGSGMRFSLRSPSGEFLLTIDRSGSLSAQYEIRTEGPGPEAGGELLATLEASRIPLADWTLAGPDGATAATVGLDGKLRQLVGYPTYVVSAPDGTGIGRFDVSQLEGSFLAMHEMAVQLTESVIPPEVGLAVAFVILRNASQSNK